MESTEHREAKLQLASWLSKQVHIEITITCNKYRKYGKKGAESYSRCKKSDVYVVPYFEGDCVEVEYASGRWVADVAVVNQEAARLVFEVLHSSKTTTPRNSLWFEITADQILSQSPSARKVSLTCVRTDSECLDCLMSAHDFASIFGKMWIDYSQRKNRPCTLCKEISYTPVWQDAYTEGSSNYPIACCTKCLRANFDYISFFSNVPRIVQRTEQRRRPELGSRHELSPRAAVQVATDDNALLRREMELLKKENQLIQRELELLKKEIDFVQRTK